MFLVVVVLALTACSAGVAQGESPLGAWNRGTGPASPSIASEARPSIRVKPASVRAGSKVLVYGSAGGCPKGDSVTLLSRAFPHTHEFAGVPAVFADVLAGDRYSHTVGIPARRRPGTYSITARCGGGNFGVRARLRVR